MKIRYRCVVSSETGKKSQIIKNACDENELLRSFAGSNMILISYRQMDDMGKVNIKTRINEENVLMFTENMASLLSSGLAVQESLSVCADITKKTATEKLCVELSRIVAGGEAFYSALSLFSPSFSALYVSMVKIGEATGSVEKVFQRLAVYLERKKQMRRKIMQTLLYPVMVCVTACAVCVFIVLYVFPRIQDVFEVFAAGDAQINGQVQGIYESLYSALIACVCIAAASVCVVLCCKYNETAAKIFDRLLLHLPLAGNIVKAFNTNDFAFAMELLSSSGIPTVQALERASEVVRNSAFREGVRTVIGEVSCGKSLSHSCERSGVFPAYVVSWLNIGERTGKVEQVFAQIHRYYEQENTHLMGSMLAAAEPAFILAAGILLLILVSRFVLPVFSLLAGM